MAEYKEIQTRIQQRYDTADRWESSAIIPLPGELIIYQGAEDNKEYCFAKVGDGVRTPSELPAMYASNFTEIATDLANHVADTTPHITADERAKWNSSEQNQNAFSNIKIGDVTIAADTKTDTLNLVAGENITLTPDAVNDKITITAKDTTYTLKSFGITATSDELNKLDGVTATTTEINYIDGVTSNIQNQLDGKAASDHTHNSINMQSMSNKDLNTIKTTGWYYGYTGMTNAPEQTIAIMEVLVYTVDWIIQRFTVVNGAEYIRYWHDGATWTDWIKTVHQGDNIEGSLSVNENILSSGFVESMSLRTRSYSFQTEVKDVDSWYRIYSSGASDNGNGDTTCIFTLGRSYNAPQNENYCFAVSISYYGDISITQLSGIRNQYSYLIDKIRVVYSNGKQYYIDCLLKDYLNNGERYNHSLFVYGIGAGYFQNPTLVDTAPPDGYTSYEFETAIGCKSDKGFSGSLYGNADTATKATQDAGGNVITSTYETKSDAAKKAGIKTYGDTYVDSLGNTITCAHGEKFNNYNNIVFQSGSLYAGNIASGNLSHAEGDKTQALDYATHAEGCQTIASGSKSHAEGYGNTASGNSSHAEGMENSASGNSSHAEGYGNSNSGDYSHVEGSDNSVSGNHSHVEGVGNLVFASYQHVQGHYSDSPINDESSAAGTEGTAFVIGNGTDKSNTSNAFRVTYSGQPYAKLSLTTTGCDYAEFFEWQDLNPNNEDRRGYFVTLDGEQIKIAEPNDYILGIISGLPSIIGNGDESWMGRYVFDEFGDFIYEDFEYTIEVPEQVIEESVNEETGEVITETKSIMKSVTRTGKKYKENPNYDPSIQYIQRQDRPEWDCVGMLGVLSVRDDGTCKVNGYCNVSEGGIATASESGYRVIKRVNDNIIKVIFK